MFLIYQEIGLNTRIVKELNSSPELNHMLSSSIQALCNSLSRFPQLSETDKFYWHFIALCCDFIQLNPWNLGELVIYKFIIDELSKIHCTYCEIKKISKVIHEIPNELCNNANADVECYFKWIVSMQRIVVYWNQKFDTGEFNYDDILKYASNISNVTTFAEIMFVENLIWNIDEITKLKDEYSTQYAKLCMLLVNSSKDSGW